MYMYSIELSYFLGSITSGASAATKLELLNRFVVVVRPLPSENNQNHRLNVLQN